MAWEQPKPTKRFAVFYRGGWYGEGDTIRDAWWAARIQTNAACDPYGARLYSNIRAEGEAREVNAPAVAEVTL